MKEFIKMNHEKQLRKRRDRLIAVCIAASIR